MPVVRTVRSTPRRWSTSYLRLRDRVGQLDFASPGHFYALRRARDAPRSSSMSCVPALPNLPRRRADHVTLDTVVASQLVSPGDDTLQIDTALTALAAVEPRWPQVVEMRYFAGMTDQEIAEAGVTDRTVRRDWDKARALLRTMV